MPSAATAKELIELLQRFPPDTPVLLPALAPTEFPETETRPAYLHRMYPSLLVRSTQIRGREHVLLGDHRQAAAEFPELEQTALLDRSVLNHLPELEEVTGLTGLTRGPLLIPPEDADADDKRLLRGMTRGSLDPKRRKAVMLEGNTEDTRTLLLVLTVESADAGDSAEAAQRAGNITRITGVPAAAAVACLQTTPDWPETPPAPALVLAWTEHQCPGCYDTFGTARGMRTHLMLEAGSAELRNGIDGYWQRYMNDLETISRALAGRFQEDPEHKRRNHPAQEVTCADCGRAYRCGSCQSG